MPTHSQGTIGEIINHGQQVPVVAFYSVQGGVGKSTLARKFAELVTVADQKPNVLLVDLDVEAQGLTFRLARGLRQNFRTVHEIIAERNVSVAQAITVTGEVSLSSGNLSHRGQLYLMPAAPPEAKGLFDTIAGINRNELYTILLDMIKALVMHYSISCVVIDCAPGANPYSIGAQRRGAVAWRDVSSGSGGWTLKVTTDIHGSQVLFRHGSSILFSKP